jgi:hypothetical protein
VFEPLKHTTAISFGHRARQGKGLAANFAMDVLGSRGRIFNFSDALKSYCRVARGMTKKDRQLLQQVGTDEFRQQDKDLWVRAMYWTLQEWDQDAKRPQVAIFADTRFPNEAALAKALGGVNVKITRYTKDGQPWVAEGTDPNHASETALADYPFDYTIDVPNKDLIFLRRCVNHIVTQHLNTVQPFAQHDDAEGFCQLLNLSLGNVDIKGPDGPDEPEGTRYAVLSETLINQIRDGARAFAA